MTNVTVYELQDGTQLVRSGIIPASVTLRFGQPVVRQLAISVDEAQVESIFKLAETRSIDFDTITSEASS